MWRTDAAGNVDWRRVARGTEGIEDEDDRTDDDDRCPDCGARLDEAHTAWCDRDRLLDEDELDDD